MLSLEHKLDILHVVVYIESSIENPDHLWIVVAPILKQRSQTREKAKHDPEIRNSGFLLKLICQEIQPRVLKKSEVPLNIS